MTDQVDYEAQGREIQRQLWGDRVADADSSAAAGADVAPDYFSLVRQYCFGMFWARPGLAVRDRSLITVAMLAALGRQDELRGHLAGARNVGISKDELAEVLMQVGVYAGVPAAVSALNTAAQVLGSD
ncbi:MAG TPA: carboxymuconolactone decarboxylase family protein [Acidimicrobiales bacterium]|nr:carboxymuconolactone decarboxylase family protein [Acidimicrobiales bacterium]